MNNIFSNIQAIASSKSEPMSYASAYGSPTADGMFIMFCLGEYRNEHKQMHALDISSEAWMFHIFQTLHDSLRHVHTA